MFERFTSSARHAVHEAVLEARALGADQVAPEHVLLALVAQGSPVLASAGFERERVRQALRAADPEVDDAVALRTIGIDLEAIRDAVTTNFGPDAWHRAGRPRRRSLFGKPLREPFTQATRKSLENAMRATVSRHDRRITDEHLILGITKDPTDTVRTLVEDLMPIAELRALATIELERVDVA